MKALSSTLAGDIVGTHSYTAGSYTATGLVVGKNYYYTMGTDDTSIAFSGGATFAKSAATTGVFTATATSATLAGGTSAVVGTKIYPLCGTNLMAATVTPTLPARQVTVGQFPANNPNFSRQVQISDQYVFVKRATYAVAIGLSDLINLALTQEIGLTWTPPVVLTNPVNTSVVATNQATITCLCGSEYTMTYAWMELAQLSKSATTLTWSGTTLSYSSTTMVGTATLTSNNTAPTDGDTVTIGGKTYTFKTTLTATEGQVLINGTADAALLNLIRAINHTGTPDTDYKCAAEHPTVSAASSVTSHAFLITSKALTTTGIYDVATTGSLKITPANTTNSGTQYYCVITDNAASFGGSNGSVATPQVTLTIT